MLDVSPFFRGLALVAIVFVGVASARTVSGQTPITGEELPCEDGVAGSYSCRHVDLLSYLPVEALGGSSGSVVNDLWGWTDPETERTYALVGRTEGLAVVDVSNPIQPVYLGTLPSHSVPSGWRDVKVYDDHAFVVSEASGHGMQVFDLRQLRDVSAEEGPVTFEETAHYAGVGHAHNVVINTDTGYAYVVGGHGGRSDCEGGLHMVNVQEPEAPTFAGCFADSSTGRDSSGYTHDAQCVVYQGPDTEYVGREICFGANETAINIADVTEKANPVTIANVSYPDVGYVHQGWLTEDHEYLYVDDEFDESRGLVDRTRTLVFDVTELDDPRLATQHMGPTGATDHDQYIEGNFAYQANYQSGLRVLSVSDPENPVEVGYFDTYPNANEPSFVGAWGTYPFFESGVVLVSSIGEGLFIVEPDVSPVRGLAGSVRREAADLQWSLLPGIATSHLLLEHRPPRASQWQQVDRIDGQSGAGIPDEYSVQDLQPGEHEFRVRHVTPDASVSVSQSTTVRVLPAGRYSVTGPFPNPAHERTRLQIALDRAQVLRVTLYDALGRRVAMLHDGSVEAGVLRTVSIQARQRASGTYFLRLQGEHFRATRKLVIAR